ncbi:MAG: hypothetical protein ABJD68_11655 [Nakamurella sp.]
MTDYRIVRLQVQNGPVKIGRAPLRSYEPAVIIPVASINAGPRGVQGVTSDGELILDVHHQDHPQSRDRRGRAGILFIGTGDYDSLRGRYGDHLVDGIAGETILLDAPDGLAGKALPTTVVVSTTAGPVELRAVRAADPCVEFSRFCLLQDVSPEVDDAVRKTLIELDGGARGYRSVASAEGSISVGDVVTI